MAIRLGLLIKQLEMCEKDLPVVFDFGGLVPDSIDSYRGYYEQLAISWIDRGAQNRISVGEIISILKNAIGKTFYGYKGGEYEMNEFTPVWAAQYGDCTSTAITGALNVGWQVVLTTAYEE